MGAFDPERILCALSKRDVRYVLVGATAARLQGFPRLTADADISPATDPDNLERLAAALRDMRARVFTESVPEGPPFSCEAETLSRSNLWNLVTDAGRLDLIFKPSGTHGYDDLIRSALRYEVRRGGRCCQPRGHLALDAGLKSSSGPAGRDRPQRDAEAPLKTPRGEARRSFTGGFVETSRQRTAPHGQH